MKTLGLRPEILKALADCGYKDPTPIQSAVIPVALQGQDILAAAQTGTGKTAGFALPLIERLAPQASTSTSPAKHPIRALILTPTRELAIQVEESIKTYIKHLPLRSLVVYRRGQHQYPDTASSRPGWRFWWPRRAGCWTMCRTRPATCTR